MLQPYVDQSDTARLVLHASVGAFIVGEVVQTFRVRVGARRANLLAELLFRLLFFAAILALVGGKSFAPDATIRGGAVTFTIGAVIGWSGLLLRWWSIITLGTYFTVVLKTSADQPIVDRGPYRFLRHPSYTGLLLGFAGCGVMLGNWVGLAGALALILVALVYRIRVEERALVAALGDAYTAYAAGRARLVPGVW